MINSIGGAGFANFAVSSAYTRNKSSASSSDLGQAASAPSAKDQFRKYMQMSPAERMEENWLRSHGLSKEKLDAMSSEQREAVIKQMKDDIEHKLQDQAAQKATQVDISV
jgi:hypothetical protein